MVGWFESYVFPKETKRPECTLEMVRSMAKGLKMIYKQVEGTADDELSKKTWANTLEELEKHWM